MAIAWLGSACGECRFCVGGECRFCVDGRETLCEAQQNSGYSVDGAFAEYAVAAAAYVVPVPDGLSSIDAAPLSCAGLTTYKALKFAHISPTEKVGIFGIGGLGHLAVQYAPLMGSSSGQRRTGRPGGGDPGPRRAIIGSIVGTRQDLAEVFALHAAGLTRVIAEIRTLDEVKAAIAEVLSGEVPARLVFEHESVPAITV